MAFENFFVPVRDDELGKLRRQAAINVPAASRIAIAILTARSAGSGHGTGSLKNTMIPSPENWSSVPSNWLTSGPKAPWY